MNVESLEALVYEKDWYLKIYPGVLADMNRDQMVIPAPIVQWLLDSFIVNLEKATTTYQSFNAKLRNGDVTILAEGLHGETRVFQRRSCSPQEPINKLGPVNAPSAKATSND